MIGQQQQKEIDQLDSSSEAYRNFMDSINSDQTRESYAKYIKYFMSFCKVTSYEDLLLLDARKLEGLIRDFITYQRHERKLAPSTVSSYLSPIAHFYEMNDVRLNWKRLNKFKGRLRNAIEDVPYTRDQIKTLMLIYGSAAAV